MSKFTEMNPDYEKKWRREKLRGGDEKWEKENRTEKKILRVGGWRQGRWAAGSLLKGQGSGSVNEVRQAVWHLC